MSLGVLQAYPAGQMEQFVDAGRENLPWVQGTGGMFAFLELHSYPEGQGLHVTLPAKDM